MRGFQVGGLQRRSSIAPRPTDRGRAIIPDLKAAWIALADDTIADLPDLDLGRLTATLQGLAANLRRVKPTVSEVLDRAARRTERVSTSVMDAESR